MGDFQLLWDEVCPHLPRWAARVLRPKLRLWTLRHDGSDGSSAARVELARLAERFWSSLSFLGGVPEIAEGKLRDSSLVEIDSDLAAYYHEEFHYLASPRRDAIHLGLAGRPNPTCVLSFSPFDLDHLLPLFPPWVRAEQVVVLSRQVTVGMVPKNTWSFAFGRACRWLRANHPDVRMVLTYLDGNLGFSGASYLATNWAFLGSEAKGRYVFIDGIPVTNRELIQRFGMARFDDLAAQLGERVARTTCPLSPLSLFGYCLHRRDRRRVALGASRGEPVRG